MYSHTYCRYCGELLDQHCPNCRCCNFWDSECSNIFCEED